MPARSDIKKILLIGSGPIVIGQACEFDYSGTQGAKALTELGYDVVLVHSNPATIMTDPELVRRTYVEPLTVQALSAIIERERPLGAYLQATRTAAEQARAGRHATDDAVLSETAVLDFLYA